MHWSKRLKDALTEKGWSAAELSRRSGVPEHSIYKYLKGRTDAPRGDVLEKVASALGVSPVFLEYGQRATDATSTTLALRRVPVLLLSDVYSLGWRLAVRRGSENRIAVPNHVGPDAFGIMVEDLALDKIPVGSVVIIDPDQPAQPGKYVAANAHAVKATVIRRFRSLVAGETRHGELLAEHPDFAPIKILAPEDGEIIGRVVMLVQML